MIGYYLRVILMVCPFLSLIENIPDFGKREIRPDDTPGILISVSLVGLNIIIAGGNLSCVIEVYN